MSIRQITVRLLAREYHGFHRSLFYKGYYDDLILGIWMRGRFCTIIKKKNHWMNSWIVHPKGKMMFIERVRKIMKFRYFFKY